MSTLFSIVGVIVFATGLFFAGIAKVCNTTGKFKTPWWSGQEATYSCTKENT